MAAEEPTATPQQPPADDSAGPSDPNAVPPSDSVGAAPSESDPSSASSAHKSLLSSLRSGPPPDPLPAGWILRKSTRAHLGSCYYYHQETGVCRWDPPGGLIGGPGGGGGLSAEAVADAVAAAAPRSILKRSAAAAAGGQSGAQPDEPSLPDKKAPADAAAADSSERTSDRDGGAASRDSSLDRSSSENPTPAKKTRRPSGSSTEREREREPEQVRVLHILKKHRGSRRPASWRNPKITDSREQAVSDLSELISILKESEGDPKELRATFEELARTESDCSSAKRGGDLGFFGRRKMQPNFEKASFALKIGELSNIVDTSSGVHVILRLA